MVLLGALSSTALAATDIATPCPEAEASSDVLHTFIASDYSVVAPLVQTVERRENEDAAVATKAREGEDPIESDDDTSPVATSPAYTTRLPGISPNDLPQFRRHMYRTDI
jgi:hypothetical protein